MEYPNKFTPVKATIISKTSRLEFYTKEPIIATMYWTGKQWRNVPGAGDAVSMNGKKVAAWEYVNPS